jgi:hypothetical protein
MFDATHNAASSTSMTSGTRMLKVYQTPDTEGLADDIAGVACYGRVLRER